MKFTKSLHGIWKNSVFHWVRKLKELRSQIQVRLLSLGESRVMAVTFIAHKHPCKTIVLVSAPFHILI